MHRVAFLLPLLLLFASCRSPEPTVRADDATPCNCPSCPPPAVTSTVASALPLDLPTMHGPEVQAILSVTIDAGGNLTVDGKKAVLADLPALAAAALAASPDVRAAIAADKDCKHGTVIAAVDRLRSAGITKVGFAVGKP